MSYNPNNNNWDTGYRDNDRQHIPTSNTHNSKPYYNNILEQYSDDDQVVEQNQAPNRDLQRTYDAFNNGESGNQAPTTERQVSSSQFRRPAPPINNSNPSMNSQPSFEIQSNKNNHTLYDQRKAQESTFNVKPPSRKNTLTVIPNTVPFNQPNPEFNDNQFYNTYSNSSDYANQNDHNSNRNNYVGTNNLNITDDFVNTSNLGNTTLEMSDYHNNTNNHNNSKMNLLNHQDYNGATQSSFSVNYYNGANKVENYIQANEIKDDFSPFRDVESGIDVLVNVDNQGDDYPINSYLKRNGTMVDPYRDNRDFHDVWARQETSLDEDPNQYQYQHQQGQQIFTHQQFNPVENLDGNFTEKQHMDLGDHSDGQSEKEIDFPLGENEEFDSESSQPNDESSSLLSNSESPQIEGRNRRNTQVRKFLLEDGNFVFDCPLSETLISSYYKSVDNPANVTNEFKFMRYQAATCEPDDYIRENFTLRQQKFLVPRQTELMIVVTMYNEDEILLGRTLKGVFDNVRHILKKNKSSFWERDAWKKIVVCIVSDGRSKINPRSLALMSALGCYQDGFAKSEINGKSVTAHIYEHTTKVNISKVTDDSIDLTCDQSSVPVQLLFCLKENNQKKINSHRWAINAFAQGLQPNVIVLLDAGTQPGKDSIYELWKEFNDPQVGGACGEIRVDLGQNYKNLLNPLVAAQNFEYKMSNILDKTTESNFGFITVLPGAFSAYRYEALKGKPLEKYFFGDNMDSIKLFASNMYLAEDRILCFEIITKENANWVLRYCKDSYGSTDVPEHIPEFMLQRRRWMNGSFFASLYSFIHVFQIWTSGQSIIRKIFLTIQSLYLLFSAVVAWFSLSSFFLVFRILTLSISVYYYEHKVFNYLAVVFLWLYGLTLLTTFILSLGNKPKGTGMFYFVVFIFFAILMIYVLFCSIYLTVHTITNLIDEKSKSTFKTLLLSTPFRDMIVSMGSTYILYIFSSVVYLQPWHMLTSFAQYMMLSPAYVNVLSVYAFCNVHDITWGTKGASKASSLGKIEANKDGSVKAEIPVSAKEIEKNYQLHSQLLSAQREKEEPQDVSFDEKKQSYYASVRSIILIIWVISNFAIAAFVLETGGIQQYERLKSTDTNEASVTVSIIGKRANIYFSVILWIVAFLAAIRAIGCVFYLIRRAYINVCKKHRKNM